MGEAVNQDLQDIKTINYSLVTALLFWCALIVVSSVYITTPLVGMFASEFHVTQTIATWTSSIFSLFYATGFLIFGPLSDRYGRKRIIVFGFCTLSVVTLLIGFTTEFHLLVLLRGVQGLVSATFAPAALAYVFDVFPKKRLVTTIGFISFGFLTAGILVKKHGLLCMLKIGLAISAIGLLLIGLSSNLFIIVSMSVVYVAGISLTFPAIMTLVGELGGST